MRVLLDENINHTLKASFDNDFDVTTVADRGWQGTQNGALLKLAADEFDVFVTMDKNLQHQQNTQKLKLAIVVVRAYSNAYAVIVDMMPRVNKAVRHAQAGTITQVTDTT
ncbi:MAG: DUF5615 family PIN-like protein [Deinococcota bacterium]